MPEMETGFLRDDDGALILRPIAGASGDVSWQSGFLRDEEGALVASLDSGGGGGVGNVLAFGWVDIDGTTDASYVGSDNFTSVKDSTGTYIITLDTPIENQASMSVITSGPYIGSDDSMPYEASTTNFIVAIYAITGVRIDSSFSFTIYGN